MLHQCRSVMMLCTVQPEVQIYHAGWGLVRYAYSSRWVVLRMHNIGLHRYT